MSAELLIESPEVVVIAGHELQFFRSSHEYFANGDRVLSVTQIISSAWPELYERTTTFALERGSIVHEITSLYDEGDLDESTVSDYLRPYFDAYLTFLRESGFTVVENERKVYSPLHRYAGTLDRIGSLNGRPALVDIKTGNPGWQCGPQTAAYAQAYHEETGRFIRNRYGLWLRDDATYSLISYTDFDNDIADFLAAQRVVARRAA